MIWWNTVNHRSPDLVAGTIPAKWSLISASGGRLGPARAGAKWGFANSHYSIPVSWLTICTPTRTPDDMCSIIMAGLCTVEMQAGPEYWQLSFTIPVVISTELRLADR